MGWFKPKVRENAQGHVSGYYKLLGKTLYEDIIVDPSQIVVKESDSKDLDLMDIVTTQWCISQGLLGYSNNAVYWVHDENTISIKSRIHNYSLLSMVTQEGLQDYNAINNDNDNHNFKTQVAYLRVKLLTVINTEVLERYVNRFYKALEICTQPEIRELWPEVHLEFPDFWIIGLIKYQLDRVSPSVKKQF